MRSLLVLTVVVLLLTLTGCVTRSNFLIPERTNLSSDRVELPTTWKEGLLLVDVTINNHGPFRLLVDTGAAGLALASDAARECDLEPKGHATVVGFYEEHPVKVVNIDSLVSGDFELRGVNAMVIDEALIAFTRLAMGRFDGIIGMGAFKDVLLELDFKNQKVAVLKRETFVPEPEASALNYTVHKGHVSPYVTVEISSRPIKMLLDTGSGSHFSLPKLDQFELAYPKEKADGGSVGLGTGHYRDLSSQLVGDIKLGPLTWRNPYSSERSGNIGARAFRNSKLIIDQHLRRIYVSAVQPLITWELSQPTALQYKPGYSFSFQGEALLVTEVDAGTAAELAGLEVGDLIIRIDGVSCREYFRNPQDSTRRRLNIKRGSAEMEIVLILALEK